MRPPDVWSAVVAHGLCMPQLHVAIPRCHGPASSMVFRGRARMWSGGGARGRGRKEDAAVDGDSSPADAVAGVSPSAEADTLPPADVKPSPHVRFIEPVTDASLRDADVESSADVDVEERELEEDLLLSSVGEEEEYRSSPTSPSPTPESEEEAEAPLGNVPRVLTEEAVPMPVPVESDVSPAPSEQAVSPATAPLWWSAASLSR
ncbi:hypothetical protein B0H14DRAFT_2868031 [Mycena olivaceomarginata]|nr:hypothetical protein B0H14DRAFT_2868031 [Mycena olivaceomarginata]